MEFEVVNEIFDILEATEDETLGMLDADINDELEAERELLNDEREDQPILDNEVDEEELDATINDGLEIDFTDTEAEDDGEIDEGIDEDDDFDNEIIDDVINQDDETILDDDDYDEEDIDD